MGGLRPFARTQFHQWKCCVHCVTCLAPDLQRLLGTGGHSKVLLVTLHGAPAALKVVDVRDPAAVHEVDVVRVCCGVFHSGHLTGISLSTVLTAMVTHNLVLLLAG